MLTYLTVFLVSLAISLLLVPLARGWGFKVGIVDRPGPLSINSRLIPRTGGLAMLVAWLGGIAYAVTAGGSSSADRGWLRGVLLPAVIFAGIGLLGDTGRASPRARLLLQVIVALVAVSLGLLVGAFPAPYVAIPLTLFYLVGGANAVNLLDGMNGLAAGVAAIASLAFAMLFAGRGEPLSAALCLALLGSSSGFLYYNFRREAQVFMGDCGSLFLGFVLATAAVLLTSKPYDFVWFLASLLILGLPIFDTLFALIRRVARRKDIFTGDRGHFYDHLVKRGLSKRGTVLTSYAIEIVASALALGLVWFCR